MVDTETKGEMNVLITGIKRNSPAEQAGLKAGDQILEVNGNIVSSKKEVNFYVGFEVSKEFCSIIKSKQLFVFRFSKSNHFQ